MIHLHIELSWPTASSVMISAHQGGYVLYLKLAILLVTLSLKCLQAKKTLVTLGLEDASHQSATLKVWLCNQKGRPDRTASVGPSTDPVQPSGTPLCLKSIKVTHPTRSC